MINTGSDGVKVTEAGPNIWVSSSLTTTLGLPVVNTDCPATMADVTGKPRFTSKVPEPATRDCEVVPVTGELSERAKLYRLITTCLSTKSRLCPVSDIVHDANVVYGCSILRVVYDLANQP